VGQKLSKLSLRQPAWSVPACKKMTNIWVSFKIPSLFFHSPWYPSPYAQSL